MNTAYLFVVTGWIGGATQPEPWPEATRAHGLEVRIKHVMPRPPMVQAKARDRAEIRAQAERAAFSMGLSPGPASRFGMAVVQHLATGRPSDDIAYALAKPAVLLDLSSRTEAVIEAASIRSGVVRLDMPAKAGGLLASMLESLPCAVRLEQAGDTARVHLDLSAPNPLTRGGPVRVPQHLWDALVDLCRRPPQGSRPWRGESALQVDPASASKGSSG